MALANAVSFVAQSAGTGAFVFASARPSFLTPAQAVSLGEMADGEVYSYLAQDSLANPVQREWGTVTFTAATNTFARNGVLGGVSSGTSSGAGVQVNFTVPPTVSLTLLAGDVVNTLTGNTNFYIATTGSDSNDGRTSASAWRTLQHAVNTLAAQYNFAGFKVTVNIGAGSFVGFGVRSMTGGGVLLFKGAGSGNTTITAGVNDGLYCFGDSITFNEMTDTVICADQVTLAPGASGSCLNMDAGGSIFCFGDWLIFSGTNVVFGTCATVAVSLTGASNIFFAPGDCFHAASTQQNFMICEFNGSVSILCDFHWDGNCTWSDAAFVVALQGQLFNFSHDFHDANSNSGTQIKIFEGGFVLFNSDLNEFPGTTGTYSILSGGTAMSGFSPAHGVLPVANQSITADDVAGLTPMTYSKIFPAPNTGNTYEPPADGWTVYLSDAVTNQIGGVVNQGSGSNKVVARFNGTDWVVAASDNKQAIRLYDDTHVLYVANLAGTVVGGSGYGNAFTYTRAGGFPFTGGTGKGGTATSVTVTAGVVTAVTPANVRGSGYMIGDVLTIDPIFLGADIPAGTNAGSGFHWTVSNATTLAGSITAGGSGYGHTASYFSVPLTGGSGSGATADIQVIVGVVTYVSVRPVSSTYIVGDVLSASNANLGGAGSGFTFTLTAIGNDTTGTGTAAAPFATGQAAWNFFKFNYYLNGHALKIQFRDGVYPGIDFTNPSIAGHNFNADMGGPGNGYLEFQGNQNNVDAVVLDDGLAGSSGNGVIDMPDDCDPIICVSNMQLRNRVDRKMFFMQFPNAQVRLLDAIDFSPNIIHMKFRSNSFTMNAMGNGIATNLFFIDQTNGFILDYTDSTAEQSFFDIDGAGLQVQLGTLTIWGVANFGDAFIRMTGQCGFILNGTPSVIGQMQGRSLWLAAGAQFEAVSVLETFWPLVGTTPPFLGDGGLINDSSSNPTFLGGGILTLTPWPFASFVSPSRAGAGSIAVCSDANVQFIGQTVTAGSGGNQVVMRSNGTNWVVIAGNNALSTTIITAKLTVSGATGSMTFTNGLLTSQIAAT